MAIIEIKNLTKKFGDFTAVDNISLEIPTGEIFGLLGPNGAGKTTTISMLATLLPITSGEARVNNHNITKDKDGVRKSIGIVFQDQSLDDELSGRENMDLHGRLYGIDAQTRKTRTDELLNLVELVDRADDQVRTYSGGMKRRLEVARGLLHHPKVLFLDEPTLGLDPQTRRKLWEYIKNFNKQFNMTIILTTHYLDEADYLCNRIGIIDHGKIIALGTSEKLKEVLGGDIITLEASDLEKLVKELGKENFKQVKIVEGKINLVTPNGSKAIPKIIEIAKEIGITVESVMLKRPSLEDVFIFYTGRTIRTEEAGGKDAMRMHRRMWRR